MTNPSPAAQVKRPRARREARASVTSILSKSHPLFPAIASEGESLLATIRKVVGTGAASNQGVMTGHIRRPFNFEAASQLTEHNEHHSTCIQAKKAATVGLGHADDQTKKKLDPLCRTSWTSTLSQVAQDFEEVGNGFIEVVRDEGGAIVGLHFQPACSVSIVVENQSYDYHYEVTSAGGTSVTLKFAAFGDLDSFLGRFPNHKQERVSELIHIMQPSNKSRWWGVPYWLAAVACIELVQSLKQHQFDFHQNRGVPEFMLFVMGTKIRKNDWNAIEAALQAQIGPGNSHKSMALNMTDPNITVQLEKLAIEGASDGELFAKMMETLSVNIVSAHRVPPPIAGILIPGKMGASNEASNAIISFQSLVIGQAQEIMETALRCTLGEDPSLALAEDAFVFRTIVEEMAESMKALQPVDTMGRMRDELPEAAAEGRDLEDGLQKADWGPETARDFLRSVFTLAEDPR